MWLSLSMTSAEYLCRKASLSWETYLETALYPLCLITLRLLVPI